MHQQAMQKTLYRKKRSMMNIIRIRTSRYYWHINLQDSEKVKMCFQSQCTDTKVIETCLKEYQTMIREVQAKFASEIQKFKEFKKLMKEELLDVISHAISWIKNFQ